MNNNGWIATPVSSSKLYIRDLDSSDVIATSNGTLCWEEHKNVSLPNEKDIEIILSPDATIVKDKYYKRETIVKKCSEDEENRELAVTFALLKMFGITPAQVQRMIANAKDYREPKKGKKHAKKNSDD